MHIVALGGSDAGISAALRAREVDPGVEFTVVVADAYPNFSICGIPYYVSGEVTHWRNLAHRTIADLEAAGMRLRLDTTARQIDVPGRKLLVTGPDGAEDLIGYDQLVIGTGAVPSRPPIAGLDRLGPADGVHLLRSMDDTFAVMRTLDEVAPDSAVIVGAGYIGLEMADALTTRGLRVTQIEQLPEVLPTVDPELGILVRGELEGRGVRVLTSSAVREIGRSAPGEPGPLRVDAVAADGTPVAAHAGLVLVVTGVRPETALAVTAGAGLGARGAIAVDRGMRTGLPGIYAAGDCVVTHHRLLGETYLPLGTTAHKQGRVAGENAARGHREFAGSLGTQVVKIFEHAAARTGLRDHEAKGAGYDPVTIGCEADDHKAYYPGSHRVHMRFTGDRRTGRLLGVQLYGHKNAEVAKRIDIAATAIFHEMTVDQISDLDLSYTPPLGSPWDAVQAGAQAWTRGMSLSAPLLTRPRRGRQRCHIRTRARTWRPRRHGQPSAFSSSWPPLCPRAPARRPPAARSQRSRPAACPPAPSGSPGLAPLSTPRSSPWPSRHTSSPIPVYPSATRPWAAVPGSPASPVGR